MVNVQSTAGTAVDRNPRPASLGPTEPPRGAIERRLVELWQDALKIEPIGVTDDYFELGGDSFAAVEMFLALEDEFGTTIQVSDILQYPTIRALAAYILKSADEADIDDPRVVFFGEEGDKKPLIFIHGLGGEVFVARKLKNCLDAERPIFAIRAVADDAWGDEAECIEDIAAEYVKIVRAKQPSGPYYLGGGCAGGVLALEMARILKSEGETIGQVILIDTARRGVSSRLRGIRYGAFSTILTILVLLFYQLLNRLGFKRRSPPKMARRDLSLHAQWWIENRLSLQSPDGRGLFVDGNVNRWQARFLAAIRRYRPEPYDGPATVFVSDELRRMTGSPSLGWDSVMRGEFKVIRAGVGHSDMWSSPQIEKVGEHIRELLAGQP